MLYNQFDNKTLRTQLLNQVDMEKPTHDQKFVELADRPSEPTVNEAKTTQKSDPGLGKSSRADELYTFKVTPQFYPDLIS